MTQRRSSRLSFNDQAVSYSHSVSGYHLALAPASSEHPLICFLSSTSFLGECRLDAARERPHRARGMRRRPRASRVETFAGHRPCCSPPARRSRSRRSARSHARDRAHAIGGIGDRPEALDPRARAIERLLAAVNRRLKVGPAKKPSICVGPTMDSLASDAIATSSSENGSASIELEIVSRLSNVWPGRASDAMYSPDMLTTDARSSA